MSVTSKEIRAKFANTFSDRKLKPVGYRGHSITIIRHSTRNFRGREIGVSWSAEVDGKKIMDYTVYSKEAAINNAEVTIRMAYGS
jgi:hypothetical protein